MPRTHGWITPGGAIAWGMAARRHHYHVYVVELADPVWNSARFRRANPDYRLGMPFVYVGMTGQDPDVRFDKHKAGIKANSFVRDHGVRLLPHLYAHVQPDALRRRARNGSGAGDRAAPGRLRGVAGLAVRAEPGAARQSGHWRILPAPLMMDSSTNLEPERMPGLKPTT